MEVVQGGHAAQYSAQPALDLATCVNAFGPPDVLEDVMTMVRKGNLLHLHPFDTNRSFLAAYAASLSVDEAMLYPARGITELIHSVRCAFSNELVYPAPDYTDLCLGIEMGGVQTVYDLANRVAQIETCAQTSKAVIFSNPCNPTGLAVPASTLFQLFQAYPETQFIVDESYVDFTANATHWSVIGTTLQNVAVLRSPTKCFGMGGVRVGALWCPAESVRKRIAKWICKWPLSVFDVAFANAALQQKEWLQRTKTDLLDATERLEDLLLRTGFSPIADVPVHFRFVPHPNSAPLAARLAERGIIVRTKSAQEQISGFRVVAPKLSDWNLFADAFLEAAQ